MSSPRKMNYLLSLDSVMLVMCALLVTSAAINEKQYDTASTFKTGADGAQRPAILGIMTPEKVNILSNITTGLGSMGFGVFLSHIIMRTTNQALAPIFKDGYHIYGTVVGMIVAVLLIVSGVVTEGIYKEVATFKDGEEKHAKRNKDGAKTFIALGAVAIIMYIVKFGWKDMNFKVSPRFRRFTAAPAAPIAGGTNRGGVTHSLTGGANAESVFFTY